MTDANVNLAHVTKASSNVNTVTNQVATSFQQPLIITADRSGLNTNELSQETIPNMTDANANLAHATRASSNVNTVFQHSSHLTSSTPRSTNYSIEELKKSSVNSPTQTNQKISSVILDTNKKSDIPINELSTFHPSRLSDKYHDKTPMSQHTRNNEYNTGNLNSNHTIQKAHQQSLNNSSIPYAENIDEPINFSIRASREPSGNLHQSNVALQKNNITKLDSKQESLLTKSVVISPNADGNRNNIINKTNNYVSPANNVISHSTKALCSPTGICKPLPPSSVNSDKNKDQAVQAIPAISPLHSTNVEGNSPKNDLVNTAQKSLAENTFTESPKNVQSNGNNENDITLVEISHQSPPSDRIKSPQSDISVVNNANQNADATSIAQNKDEHVSQNELSSTVIDMSKTSVPIPPKSPLRNKPANEISNIISVIQENISEDTHNLQPLTHANERLSQSKICIRTPQESPTKVESSLNTQKNVEKSVIQTLPQHQSGSTKNSQNIDSRIDSSMQPTLPPNKSQDILNDEKKSIIVQETHVKSESQNMTSVIDNRNSEVSELKPQLLPKSPHNENIKRQPSNQQSENLTFKSYELNANSNTKYFEAKQPVEKCSLNKDSVPSGSSANNLSNRGIIDAPAAPRFPLPRIPFQEEMMPFKLYASYPPPRNETRDLSKFQQIHARLMYHPTSIVGNPYLDRRQEPSSSPTEKVSSPKFHKMYVKSSHSNQTTEIRSDEFDRRAALTLRPQVNLPPNETDQNEEDELSDNSVQVNHCEVQISSNPLSKSAFTDRRNKCIIGSKSHDTQSGQHTDLNDSRNLPKKTVKEDPRRINIKSADTSHFTGNLSPDYGYYSPLTKNAPPTFDSTVYHPSFSYNDPNPNANNANFSKSNNIPSSRPSINSRENVQHTNILSPVHNKVSNIANNAYPNHFVKPPINPYQIPVRSSIFTNVAQEDEDNLSSILQKLHPAETLNPEQYVTEMTTLESSSCPKPFLEFYSYLTKKQIANNQSPISFRIFLEFHNAGKLKNCENAFRIYSEKHEKERKEMQRSNK
ncbi:hypothetical protein ILUMI_04310 [Ignelater luminosus]|uniref:Uncharacterized protein n=1 Tax=Ignelater luminosus TaxID=2038154 RepID=A0A8K0D9X6_IGNLU|nr:hypothetical protein ILUMI_04310 [Ignelater luminosus]